MDQSGAAPKGLTTDPPVVLGLLVCEQIGTTPAGNPIIMEVFDRIGFGSLPAAKANLTVFVRLWGVLEPMDLEIRITAPDDSVIASLGPASIQPPSNAAPVSLGMRGGPITFKVSGQYHVRLFANGSFLGLAPLEVVERPRT